MTDKNGMMRWIVWACCGAFAFAACGTTSTGGSGGTGFKLPDAGKTYVDGTSSGTDNTGTGTGDDKTCTPACPAAANADATCTAGVCGFSCHVGFLDCDGNPKNGCEIDSSTHPSHCGTCDKVCGDIPNGTAACVNSVCGAACDPGWQVCKNDPLVCDTNTDADETHCGDCATECPGGPNATPRCINATCELKCAVGWADCNKITDDGCEINTTNDPEHCGSCGLVCDTKQCVSSACECASSTQTATLIPLDIFIMMDQSGSMGETTGTGAAKWDAVTAAVKAFVQDPASAGIGVGIQYFPLSDDCPSSCDTSAEKAACKAAGGSCSTFIFITSCDGCTSKMCSAPEYAKPEVAIQTLPAAASAITTSLAKHGPVGTTPTQAALQGAVDYAKSHALANPTHTVVVLLATDGEPTECNIQDPAKIATSIAAPAAAGTPKILTFVIGVGSSLTAMNQIAAAGGTGNAFIVDTGGNVLQQFQAALKAIQGKALGCQYSIPVPTNGQPVDYTKVNVQLTVGGTPKVLAYVTSEAKCDPTAGGWHYDDPLAPTKILLCGNTCASVTADTNAKVDIQLGCPRVGKEP